MTSKNRVAGVRRAPSRQLPLGAWFDRHPKTLRTLAVFALLWGLVYLTWRVLYSFDGVNPVFAAVLFVTEVFGWFSLVYMMWFSWTRPPANAPPISNDLSVDVVVCTYNEPEEVLRATLTGTRALTYSHTTYVLDDGNRAWVKDLAESYGAIHVTRPDNSHAKAGNINHALENVLTGDLLFILDADHIPVPGALEQLVGYFEDDRLALVQTPHDFFNHDSVQHYGPGRHDQSVFFDIILPGKNRHDAVFWCGSASMIRRTALAEVGGVATDTIAEDFHTTIKLHTRKWKTFYHNEILVQGLGPLDLDGYLIQRDRWCQGNLAVIHTAENPLLAPNLTFKQRISHLYTLRSYFAAPVRMLQLVIVIIAFSTALLPMSLEVNALAVLWVPWLALSTLSGVALCRGFAGSREAAHYELITAEVHAKAIMSGILGLKRKFKVTPKRGEDNSRDFARLLNLKWLTFLGAVLVLLLLARIVDTLLVVNGREGFLPELPPVALGVLGVLAIFETYQVFRSLAKVTKRQQRRIDYRFDLPQLPAQLDSSEATIIDLSTSGASLRVEELSANVGDSIHLSSMLPKLEGGSEPFQGELLIRNIRHHGDRLQVGGEFINLSEKDKETLYRCCFLTGALGKLSELKQVRREIEPITAEPRLRRDEDGKTALRA